MPPAMHALCLLAWVAAASSARVPLAPPPSGRWHYYLFDFCYYANLLLVLHLWLLPHSALLAKVTNRTATRLHAVDLLAILHSIQSTTLPYLPAFSGHGTGRGEACGLAHILHSCCHSTACTH